MAKGYAKATHAKPTYTGKTILRKGPGAKEIKKASLLEELVMPAPLSSLRGADREYCKKADPAYEQKIKPAYAPNERPGRDQYIIGPDGVIYKKAQTKDFDKRYWSRC